MSDHQAGTAGSDPLGEGVALALRGPLRGDWVLDRARGLVDSLRLSQGLSEGRAEVVGFQDGRMTARIFAVTGRSLHGRIEEEIIGLLGGLTA